MCIRLCFSRSSFTTFISIHIRNTTFISQSFWKVESIAHFSQCTNNNYYFIVCFSATGFIYWCFSSWNFPLYLLQIISIYFDVCVCVFFVHITKNCSCCWYFYKMHIFSFYFQLKLTVQWFLLSILLFIEFLIYWILDRISHLICCGTDTLIYECEIWDCIFESILTKLKWNVRYWNVLVYFCIYNWVILHKMVFQLQSNSQ